MRDQTTERSEVGALTSMTDRAHHGHRWRNTARLASDLWIVHLSRREAVCPLHSDF